MGSGIILALLTFAPSFECHTEQQAMRCERICAAPEAACSEFLYENCIAGCMDKSEPLFVDIFEDCVECFTVVQCDPTMFSARCGLACMF